MAGHASKLLLAPTRGGMCECRSKRDPWGLRSNRVIDVAVVVPADDLHEGKPSAGHLTYSTKKVFPVTKLRLGSGRVPRIVLIDPPLRAS